MILPQSDVDVYVLIDDDVRTERNTFSHSLHFQFPCPVSSSLMTHKIDVRSFQFAEMIKMFVLSEWEILVFY